MIFCLFLELFSPQSFPKNMIGWVQIGFKDYNKENIFDYIDGAGEVYISYNFKKLYVFNYKKGKNEITLDIFEMKGPKNSFGIFTHIKGKGEVIAGLGEEAEIFGNSLIFWKGDYFVSVSSREDISKNELVFFGKEVEKYLKGKKLELEILKYAQILKLDLKKIKYFSNMNILNYNYYIINKDIFSFQKGTEGIFSPFKDGYVLLLLFKDEKMAKMGLRNLKEKFYRGDFEIKEIEKDKWSSCILKNKLLTIFLDFPSKEKLLEVMNENR